MQLILLVMFVIMFTAKVFGQNDYTWLQVFSPIIIFIIVVFLSALFDKD